MAGRTLNAFQTDTRLVQPPFILSCNSHNASRGHRQHAPSDDNDQDSNRIHGALVESLYKDAIVSTINTDQTLATRQGGCNCNWHHRVLPNVLADEPSDFATTDPWKLECSPFASSDGTVTLAQWSRDGWDITLGELALCTNLLELRMSSVISDMPSSQQSTRNNPRDLSHVRAF